MLEIATEFLNNDNWDGNFLTSSTSALFDAFICYKQQKEFDCEEALYLCTRGGSIGSYKTFNELGEFTMVFFGPKDLIRELDGEGFFVWLNSLADIAEHECELYSEGDENYYDEIQVICEEIQSSSSDNDADDSIDADDNK